MVILPLFMFVVGALVAAVVLIVRGGAGRWVGVVLLAVLALPVLALFFVRAVAPSARPAVVVTPQPAPYAVRIQTTPAEGHAELHAAMQGVIESYNGSQHVTVQGEAHAESHEQAVAVEAEDHGLHGSALDPVPADVVTPLGQAQWLTSLNHQDVAQEPHTSTQTLVKYMAERVVASVEKVSGEGVHRITSEPQVPRELFDAISSQIHATDKRPEGLAKDETVVKLKWNGRTERRMTWWPTPMLKGTLEAHVAGPKGTAVITARLDEKPWLYEQDRAQRGGAYAVVVSDAPEATPAQAVEAVKRSAQGMLVPRVQAELVRMSNGTSVPHPVLRQQVLWAAHSNRGVLDECVVRVDRPYGPVYYAAQLHDVRPGVLQPIASASIAASTERRQTFAGMIAGLGGMVLVLGLLYLALNALTRGYFRGRLRAATVVAALGIGAALLVLIA